MSIKAKFGKKSTAGVTAKNSGRAGRLPNVPGFHPSQADKLSPDDSITTIAECVVTGFEFDEEGMTYNRGKPDERKVATGRFIYEVHDPMSADETFHPKGTVVEGCEFRWDPAFDEDSAQQWEVEKEQKNTARWLNFVESILGEDFSDNLGDQMEGMIDYFQDRKPEDLPRFKVEFNVYCFQGRDRQDETGQTVSGEKGISAKEYLVECTFDPESE